MKGVNRKRTTKRKNANRLSARTIARWENEGGAPKPLAQEKREQRAALAEEEERVLRCLGAAVIMQWNDLSTGTQRALFEYAVSMGDPHDTAQLKGQVARFLHKYKNAVQKRG